MEWNDRDSEAETDESPGDPGGVDTPEARDARLRRVLEAHLDFAGRTLRLYGVSEADVDDGMQQVCLVLVERLDDIVPGSERGFVFSTARRVASHIRRGRRRRCEVPEGEAAHVQMSFDVEEIADARRALDVLSAGAARNPSSGPSEASWPRCRPHAEFLAGGGGGPSPAPAATRGLPLLAA